MRRLALVAAVALAGPAAAQSPVLAEPGSVRGAALQGAGAALVGDAGSVFSNPAGLATIAHIALEASYYRLTSDNTLWTGAFAWRLGQFDFGAGVKYFDYGATTDYDALGVGSLIYRRGLIALGGSVKGLRRETAAGRSEGIGADLGLALAFFDIMALGFAVQNVGGNLDDASTLALPRLTRLGFTMNYVDPQEAFRLLTVIEGQWAEGVGARVVLGLEAGIVLPDIVGLIGRIAYGGRFDGAVTSRMTYGLTAELGWILVDYALEPTDLLGERGQRIGVRLPL